MSKREKFIARIRARPPETDFDDVRCLLEYFGWFLDRVRGSHFTFVKEGEFPLTVPVQWLEGQANLSGKNM